MATTDTGHLLFVYGSLMDRADMKRRCPGAEPVGIASLADAEVCFPRWSKIRNCHVGGYRKAPGKTLWGGLWRITDDELAALDQTEGYTGVPTPEDRYRRVTLDVTKPDGSIVRAQTYIAMPESEGLPNAAYLSLLVRGAKDLGLPAAYVEQLAAHPVLETA